MVTTIYNTHGDFNSALWVVRRRYEVTTAALLLFNVFQMVLVHLTSIQICYIFEELDIEQTHNTNLALLFDAVQ